MRVIGVSLRSRSGLALGMILIWGQESQAQSVFQLRPSFSTTQMHDNNLFFADADRQEDFVTRLTPKIESEYRLPLWTLTGSYAFDLERFTDHQELSSAYAGHRALSGIEYRPTERLVFAVGGEVSRTRRPGELSPQTGLSFARATAQRTGASASLTRRMTPTRTGKIAYTFSEDRLAGSIAIRTHGATLSADTRLSSRDMLTTGYRYSQFAFGSTTAETHALNFGWTRAVTSRIDISIDGGPNVTQRSPGFDTAVSLRSRFKAAEQSLAYARTRTTVLGVAGIVQAQSLSATTALRPLRKLQIQITPAVYRSERAALRVDVYRLGVAAIRPLSDTLSLQASYDSSWQSGGLFDGLADQVIRRHEAMITFVAAPASHAR